MILPIGNNCNIATALKNLNIRRYSYPFDWILVSDNCLHDFIFFLLNLKIDDNNKCSFDIALDEFFNIDNNKIYLNNSKEVFVNKKYEATFLHDDISTIKEKYHRRIKRMINDFYSADRVDLIYASRWTRHDKTLLSIMDSLSSLRHNIFLHSINGFENYPPLKYTNIYCYFIDFKEEYGWSYDVIYTKQLEEIFKVIFLR